MTQDGFAAADRITATLDAACAALLGSRATHYQAAALTAFRQSEHPAAKALFGLRISQIGPGLLAVPKLGTVVEVSSLRRPNAAAGREAVPVLTNRFGASALGLGDLPSAAALRLHAEPTGLEGDGLAGFTPALAALAEPRVTVAPDELSTGSGVEARLVVPPLFHTLTVRGSGNALSAHLAETAEEVFSGGSPAERNDFAVVAALLAEQFAAADVAYAGIGALLMDGRRSRVSLLVSTVQCSQPIQDLAVDLSTERPYAEVWTVLLPAGPAALLVETRVVPTLKELRDENPNGHVRSTVVEAFVPMPDGATVLTVQLSTSDSEDWTVYTSVFADLLCTVQLAWDGVSVAPAPVPVGRAFPAAPPVSAPAPLPVPAQTAPTAPPAPPAQLPVAAAPEPADSPSGTAVRVPPSDFNPFGTPGPGDLPAQATASPVLASADAFAAPAAPAPAPEPAPTPTAPAPEPVAPAPVAEAPEEADPAKGRLVKVPPPDFNPFAQTTPPPATPAPAPAPVAAAADPFGGSDPFATPDPFAAPTPAAPVTPAPAPVAEAREEADPTKGRLVKVPPPDFNPFAPPAPSTTTPAEAPEEADPTKGRLVKVPPPDFNPFAQTTPPPATPAPAPAAPQAPAPTLAAAPSPAAADPFGTTLSSEPADPFGTVTSPSAGAAPSAIPPRPSAPPLVPPPAAAEAPEEADPTKGRLVKVPPPDFNPFAPPAPSTTTPAEAPEEADPTKGRLVKVPPPDFNPFAQTTPPPATPAPAPAAPQAPPQHNPFG
ncbi:MULTISPECIES: hypothetical protein [Kitasatospora]|uniref:Uncharacterized protein n=1 Tax=Kitasatospora setae (strain ATCC 33774 / DSM 43861 / JCM 3304 / KCC A-0304 / NBRC 14216 / KM-6054) TaxID=452652 RepID=E4N8M8_KITSK|nr:MULTISPECIES: hypothetical protein [Kitasatospora]BAJ27559.1 hypothetical protein KSE_17350 [Kitasatospora setae KM-6054]